MTNARLARRQMPEWLQIFDDRWGIVWRVKNAVRNVQPVRFARFARAGIVGSGLSRPVFVIGTPRSGTSLLYEILSRHPDLAAMGHEGHDIWRKFHHPRKTGWDSDVIDPARARPALERRFAEAFIRARTSSKPGATRFVEKTPDNALRTDYIRTVFPDAKFVSITRDPCATVSSYIDGWRDPDGRFRSYYVPDALAIPGYEHRSRWCSTLIPGWRGLTGAPIPEIALRQWEAYVRALAAARETLGPDRLLEIHLEGLLADPQGTVRRVAAHFDLPLDDAVMSRMVETTRTRVNAFSADGSRSWEDANGEEIRALLDRIVPLAQLIGYDVDPESGASQIVETTPSDLAAR